MELIEQNTSTTTSEIFHIEDKGLGVKWFIDVEFRDGKFVKSKEMINPDLLKQQGGKYIQEVYNLVHEQLKDKYGL